MQLYERSKYASDREFKDAVLRDRELTDLDKLQLIFSVSKDALRRTDCQLYYAILAVLDANKKPAPPPSYFGIK